jgi:16S rRNA (adenine1518-N6/adenine1519-N6)-dimethyltransferase
MTAKARPEPSKDQHLMTNAETVAKIVSAASLGRKDVVLEAGAGSGLLTVQLAKTGARIIAVEIDRRFAGTLGRLEAANVEIIYANALDVIDKIQFNKFVSNIPYSICEPLMNKLIKRRFTIAVISVPDSFYKKIYSRPGEKDYSFLSLRMQSFFSIEFLFEIHAADFSPPPKTESVAIAIRPLNDSEYEKSPEKFVFRELFLQRTKKLKNALMEALINVDKKLHGRQLTKKAALANMAKMRLGKKILQKKVEEMRLNDFEAVRKKLRISS